MFRLTAVAALAALPAFAEERQFDVETVSLWCRLGTPDCSAFIAGLHMGILLMEEHEGSQPVFRFCVPRATTQAQLKTAITKGLADASGEVPHFPARRIVYSTLREAFPCQE